MKNVLSPLRARVRRTQLIAGLGILAAAVGGMVSASLVIALLPYFRHGHSRVLVIVIHTLVSRLWVYGLLPILWLGVSRLIRDLHPWRAAIGSALVGEACYLAIDWLGPNSVPEVLRPEISLPRLLTLLLGMLLSARAIASAQPTPSANVGASSSSTP